MPAGPEAAAIVLAVAAACVALYFAVEYMRHGRGRRGGASARPVERLPLFSTENLAGGTPPERRRTPRATPAVAPVDSGLPSGNGRAAASDVGSFAPPRPQTASANGAGDALFAAPAAPQAPRDGAQPLRDAPLATPERPRDAPAARPSAPRPSIDPLAPALGAAAGPSPFSTVPVAAARPAPAGSANGAALLEGETLRFSIPDDGTLQFLPGRLEVVAGPDTGSEIRFVRTPGEQVTEVTFGRSDGPTYRHVQLLARTVSRQHAAMTLIDDHWQLTNLSATNPVVLNGRKLQADEVAPLLVDGDRIEMGEVIFVFHTR